jgi:Domain of unknown function (DUF4276)
LKIQTLVEGQGDEAAVPVLLRRLQRECQAFDLSFGHPIRRHRSELVNEEPLRRAIRAALQRDEGCSGILLIFDGDLDCPRDLAPRIQSWARAEAGHIPCEVVIAYREYESWFLASLDSLRGHRGIRGDALPHPDPESMRGAKARLTSAKEGDRSYSETKDQPAFTARFDLAAAYRSCRSFRRMVRAFGLLAAAAGAEIGDWPPPSWLA